MASQARNYTAAGTYTLTGVNRLHRVVVNTGVASATVVVRYATSDDAIATIAADNPDIGRVYDLEFPSGTDLEVVLSGATDVTVLYD